MDEAALRLFLMDASRRGYAAGRSALTVPEADHSTTIVHEDGEWRFHDNYFGGSLMAEEKSCSSGWSAPRFDWRSR